MRGIDEFSIRSRIPVEHFSRPDALSLKVMEGRAKMIDMMLDENIPKWKQRVIIASRGAVMFGYHFQFHKLPATETKIYREAIVLFKGKKELAAVEFYIREDGNSRNEEV